MNRDKNARYKNPDYLYQEYVINNKSPEEIGFENNTTAKAIRWQLHINHIVREKQNLISKETLIELYVNTNNSIEEVGRILGVTGNTVAKYLDKYGIEKQYRPAPQYDASNDAAWIDLYLNKHMSAAQIAIRYNTTHSCVLNHLRHNGIEIRSMQESQRCSNGNYYLHPDLKNPDVLMNLHYNYHYNIGTIGDMYRCDYTVINKCFQNLGIQTFNQNTIDLAPPAIYTDHKFETSLSVRVRNHCLRYINPIVLQRDNYHCVMCGSTDSLEVHHGIFSLATIIFLVVDMHPEYSISENISELFNLVINDPLFLDLDNLVTVCSGCHHKIHLSHKMYIQY